MLNDLAAQPKQASTNAAGKNLLYQPLKNNETTLYRRVVKKGSGSCPFANGSVAVRTQLNHFAMGWKILPSFVKEIAFDRVTP